MMLGSRVHFLDDLFPALLGQWRNREADEFAVIARVEPQIADTDRLLDRSNLRNIPRLNRDQAWLGNMQIGHLIERRGGAVIIHANMVQNAKRGAPGTDGRHLV